MSVECNYTAIMDDAFDYLSEFVVGMTEDKIVQKAMDMADDYMVGDELLGLFFDYDMDLEFMAAVLILADFKRAKLANAAKEYVRRRGSTPGAFAEAYAISCAIRSIENREPCTSYYENAVGIFGLYLYD